MAGGRRNVRVTRWIILFEMRRLSTFALVFVLFVSAAASAQGLVTGVVKDTNQRPIKGATITAESSNSRSVTVTSDAKGRYAFLGLRGGAWTLFERKRDTAAAVAEYQALLKVDPANAKARAALDRLAQR